MISEHIVIKKKIRYENKELPSNQRRLDTGLSEDELIRALPKIYDGVVRICSEYPSCKGNYMELCWRYYRKFYPDKFKITFRQFRDIYRLPSPESITRAFRKAVENGAIEPTSKMRKRRAQREEAMRNNIHALGVGSSSDEMGCDLI